MADIRPENEMVRRALPPGALAVPVAFAIGSAVGDMGAGVSAALAVAVVVVNFAAHGASLAWAAGVSITTVHVTALVGVLARLGAIVALLFLLDGLDWFSPAAFGLGALPTTIALLTYEARLVRRGLGAALQIPAESAAARAAAALAAREAR